MGEQVAARIKKKRRRKMHRWDSSRLERTPDKREVGGRDLRCTGRDGAQARASTPSAEVERDNGVLPVREALQAGGRVSNPLIKRQSAYVP